LNKSEQDEVLRIEPVAMNLVNRLAEGSVANGPQAFRGGLLLQGQWLGSGIVKGNLVLWHSALMVGHFKIEGDLYVFGNLGAESLQFGETMVECQGTTFMANTAICSATLLTVGLRLYDGANISGTIKTMKGYKSKDLARR
jgi:hypothetical protein